LRSTKNVVSCERRIAALDSEPARERVVERLRRRVCRATRWPQSYRRGRRCVRPGRTLDGRLSEPDGP